MKCYFCNKTILKDKSHSSFLGLEIGNCRNCQSDIIVTTTVTDGEKIISAHLYVDWGQERYQLLLHLKDNYFAIVHLTPKTNEPRDEIYKSEGIPDINFQNALSKLSTILTFL